MDIRAQVFRRGLDLLYYSGAHRLLESRWRGIGAVLMLHHVRPASAVGPSHFAPNEILEITPDFLATVLECVRAAGCEFVSLDTLHERLSARGRGAGNKRMVAITLDDGYADNLVHAMPVFERFEAPFTVYVTTGIVDGTARLWWKLIERALADNDAVAVEHGGVRHAFGGATVAAKREGFNALAALLATLPQSERVRIVDDIVTRYGLDPRAQCAEVALNLEQLRALSAAPLCTIGAHTLGHEPLALLDEGEVTRQLTTSRAQLQAWTGDDIRHFAYPYGDSSSAGPREFRIAATCGYDSAVTTRKGLLFDEHRGHLHALPRLSINGDYQQPRYPRLLLGGAPFALWNRFSRLNVA